MKRAALIAACWIAMVWLGAFLFDLAPAVPGSPQPTSGNPLDRWDATWYKALVIPMTIAQLRPIQRTTVLIVSVLIQLTWLYGFVTWTTHV